MKEFTAADGTKCWLLPIRDTHQEDMGRMEFMQYPDPRPLDVPHEATEALSEYGQFHSCTDDFRFLARLRAGKASEQEIDEWFLANEKRLVSHIAQGVLAAVYGRDPP